jgi:acetolactate decarboxylase
VSIDPALAKALHIVRMTRSELDATEAHDHEVWQTSSIDALLDGEYEGDLTFAELAAHGDLGIGTVQHLDGEMVALDGEFFNITADGAVHRVDPTQQTPFAVLCRFRPEHHLTISEPTAFDALTSLIDAVTPPDQLIVAVRVDGAFRELRLRSVPGQHKPYPPLSDVVASQSEWRIAEARGSLIGFRFPADAQGIDVAGYHLHFISDDRVTGGHVIDITVVDAAVLLDGSSDLHLEVPAGVTVGDGDTSALKGAVIRAVEGR